MVRKRFRAWFATCMQHRPHLHDYLLGAVSAIALFPAEDDDLPAPQHRDRAAALHDMHAVGQDMWAACSRPEPARRIRTAVAPVQPPADDHARGRRAAVAAVATAGR
jgi:hypothetical protein